mgnify:FL=1
MRVKDGWEMTISIIALLSSMVIFYMAFRERDELLSENAYLKHNLKLVCDYIDSLPRKYRAVFDACLK